MADKEINLTLKVDAKQVSEGTTKLTRLQKAHKAYLDTFNKEGVETRAVQKAKAALKRQQDLEIAVTNAAKGSREQLSAQYSLNIIKLNKLSGAERKGSVSGRKLTADTKKLRLEMKALDKSIDSNVLNVGNYGTKLKGFAQQLIGGFGVLFAIQSVIRGIKDSIAVFREFEKGQSTLAAVLQKTKAETKELSDLAVELGKSTSFTSKEVTDLQIAYARLGFTQQQIIDQTKATLDGAVALQAELGAMAALTGASLKAFNKDSSETTQVVDAMVLATQKSGLSFERLQTGIPIVGKAANAAGDSFETMLSKLGKLSDNAIDASSSASALRNIYIDLKTKGLTYDEAMTKILDSTDRLATANELFSKRGAVVALTLAETKDEVVELDEALINATGSAEKFAKDQLDNLDGSMVKFGSMLDGLKVKIGSSSGVLREFIDRVTDFGNAVGDTVDDKAQKVANKYFDNIRTGAKESGNELGFLSRKYRENQQAINKAMRDLNEAAESNVFIKTKIKLGDFLSIDTVGIDDNIRLAARAVSEIGKTQELLLKDITERRNANESEEIRSRYNLESMSNNELAELHKTFLNAKTEEEKRTSEVVLEDLTRTLQLRLNKEADYEEALLKGKKEAAKVLFHENKELQKQLKDDELEKEDKEWEREISDMVKAAEMRKKVEEEIRLSEAATDEERELLKAEQDAEKKELELEKMVLEAEERTELEALLLEQKENTLQEIRDKWTEKKEKAQEDADKKEIAAKTKMSKIQQGIAKALSSALGGILGDSLAGQIAGVAVDAAIQSASVGIKSKAAQASNLAIAASVGPPANLVTIPTAKTQNIGIAASSAKAIGGIWSSAALSAGSSALGKVKLGKGGDLYGASHEGGGMALGGGVEVEGGEFVVNKRSMKNPQLRGLVETANAIGNGEGGTINTGVTEERVAEIAAITASSIPVVVVEQDITEVQRVVKVRESEFNG